MTINNNNEAMMNIFDTREMPERVALSGTFEGLKSLAYVITGDWKPTAGNAGKIWEYGGNGVFITVRKLNTST